MQHLNKVAVFILFFIILTGGGVAAQPGDASTKTTPSMDKILVEIWSDVMCPFCYIGKRQFEAALAQFPDRERVEVVWKSFQLDPDLKTNPDKSVVQSLMESKGWSEAQTRQAMSQVIDMAASVGLTYHFDKAVVANSFDAHRFTHFAKKRGLQSEAEEKLFAAYFTEGRNTADHQVLAQLGAAIGLDAAEVLEVLAGNGHADEVRYDIYEARQIGVTGVPFFVFNRKYAVSGARGTEVFSEMLEKAAKD
jgi:predicted DsbA family dithiol-disulfide isomerase